MLPASDENSGAPAQPLTRANQQHKPAAQHRKRKSVEDSDGTQSSVSAPQAPASTAAGLTTAPGAAARSSSRLRSGQVMMPAIQQTASAHSRSSGPAAKRHHTTGEYPHNVDIRVLLLMSPCACVIAGTTAPSASASTRIPGPRPSVKGVRATGSVPINGMRPHISLRHTCYDMHCALICRHQCLQMSPCPCTPPLVVPAPHHHQQQCMLSPRSHAE